MKEEWKKVKLGEVLDSIIGGGTPSKSVKNYWNGNLYWCSVKDMSDDIHYLEKTEDTITEEGLKNSTANLIKKGTVITATRMGLGRAFINKVDMTINQDLKALIPNSKIDNIYLLWTIIANRSVIANQGRGATVPGITLDMLKDLDINLPPLPTQQKIASVLSAYDDLIENNRRQIKLLEEAALKLYKEWFVKLNFPGHETTKIADGIPDGWIETTIGDIVKIKSGFSFKSEWWQEKGYPVVKIKDIGNNTLDITSFDFVSEERTLKCKDFLLNEGDLVIAMTGATIGKIGLVPKIDNLYTNQRVGKFFPNDKGEWQTPFLFCFYNSDSIQNQIIALSSSSSAQPNISGNQLESFKVILNKNLINLFNRITEPMFKKILKCQIEIQKCQLARDKLLPKLMNGEIEV